MAILTELQKKLHISTKRKTLSALDGAYKAVYHSRSLDFDDLKEYSQGDNAKDIAWKASAKSPSLLVKRTIADKQFPVLFIVDSGLKMNALDAGGDTTRKTIAEAVITVLGTVALRHHDSIGCFIGDDEKTKRLPFKNTTTHLESMLKILRTDFQADTTERSNIRKQIELVMKLKTQRSIVVIISDSTALNEDGEKLVQKVTQKHDVIWVSIVDANPFALQARKNVEDIETGTIIPTYLRTKKSLEDAYFSYRVKENEHVNMFFKKNRISFTEVGSLETVIPLLTTLLQRKAHE